MCAVLEISPKTYYKYRNKEDPDYYDYLVFDLNEMRLYQSLKEYQNRDISDAQFTKITNHTSSTSLNQ